MYAAIAAYIATNVLTTVKRQMLIYSVVAVGALFTIFAAAYGVDTVHTLLMFRFGGVFASLAVAAFFLVVAAGLFAIAYRLKRPPAKQKISAGRPTLYAVPPHYSRGKLAFVAGAFAATVAASFAAVRRFRANP